MEIDQSATQVCHKNNIFCTKQAPPPPTHPPTLSLHFSAFQEDVYVDLLSAMSEWEAQHEDEPAKRIAELLPRLSALHNDAHLSKLASKVSTVVGRQTPCRPPRGNNRQQTVSHSFAHPGHGRGVERPLGRTG
jgi:hypothetical protein